jgi:predicted PurR-regulated permease PerM
MPDRAKQGQWLVLVVATAAAVYLCWKMVQPFVNVLLWAVVLTIVSAPVYSFLLRKTRKPALSALVSILAVVLAFVLPLGLAVGAVVAQAGDLATTGPAKLQALLADPVQGAKLQELLDRVQPYVDVRKYVTSEALSGYAGKISGIAVQKSLSVLGGALGVLVNAILVIFTMFYLLRDGHAITERLPDVLPLERSRASAILRRTVEIVKASVFGVVLIAVIQGAMGGVMFAVLGVPSPVLWGMLMVLAAMIPLAGTALVWAPAALFLGLTGHWGKAIILVLWGALAIGMVDNLLRPRMVGKRIQMHDLLVFFSVLGGIQAFGLLGVLLGPVVLALATGLLDVLMTGGATEPLEDVSEES